jgi:hypothetical protein
MGTGHGVKRQYFDEQNHMVDAKIGIIVMEKLCPGEQPVKVNPMTVPF